MHNPCLSGGTLEIFLDPVVPAPLLAVHGDSPIARAVVDLGGALGWQAALVDEGTAVPEGTAAVVVAMHGRGDEEGAIASALAAGAPYVGLVASHKRGEAVLGGLPVDEAERARVHSPTGLDIGARTPQEVALSILAEVVAERRTALRSTGRDRDRARRDRHRPGVRHDRRRGRRVAAPRPRRRPVLVLRQRLPPGVRRRPRRLPDVVTVPAPDAGGLAGLLPDVPSLADGLRVEGYLPDDGLATALFCAARLPQPILLEGEAGVGKTAAALALARVLDTPLLRLQCYDGIDAAEALYEWNYPRQLLAIRLAESQHTDVAEDDLFDRRFLVGRPLLQAVEHPGPRPAVLLVDEVDRADEEFEAFLLELLAEGAITVPEVGTLRAVVPPLVVLTSNRTRDLHDALKRRCLYHWIDYPPLDRVVEIIRHRVPGAAADLGTSVARSVERLRSLDLQKPPGVAEAIDWVQALRVLGLDALDADAARQTVGSVLKYREDHDLVQARGMEWLAL